MTDTLVLLQGQTSETLVEKLVTNDEIAQRLDALRTLAKVTSGPRGSLLKKEYVMLMLRQLGVKTFWNASDIQRCCYDFDLEMGEFDTFTGYCPTDIELNVNGIYSKLTKSDIPSKICGIYGRKRSDGNGNIKIEGRQFGGDIGDIVISKQIIADKGKFSQEHQNVDPFIGIAIYEWSGPQTPNNYYYGYVNPDATIFAVIAKYGPDVTEEQREIIKMRREREFKDSQRPVVMKKRTWSEFLFGR